MTDSAEGTGITVSGRKLLMDGQPFLLQGVSFFNALYNPTFNRSDDDRRFWLRKFRDNGVNLIRIFLQWDRLPDFPLVDVTPETSLYTDEGAVRDNVFGRLEALIRATEDLGMALETCMFMGMGRPTLSVPARERAVAEVRQRSARSVAGADAPRAERATLASSPRPGPRFPRRPRRRAAAGRP